MPNSNLLDASRGIADWITGLRRRIHQHPETAFEEFETSRVVRETLDSLDIPYEHPFATTGVLGRIGNGNGPCVALRADMDALPIHEESGVPFASQVPGKMHACGHDCHTAMLLGAARLLKERESEIQGTVKLVFQPAEEGENGGLVMCNEGILENPKVERAFGLHVWPYLPAGMIAGKAGVLLASVDMFDIVVTGCGGHAAIPHATIDPVATAAKIVCELQTIVSREVDPFSPAVLSVTAIHGGEAFNVIPETVALRGTIRGLTVQVMEQLQRRIREISTGVAAANRCTAEVKFGETVIPPTVNDAECWEITRRLGQEVLGQTNVADVSTVMGGEDFSYIAQRVPACFAFVGVKAVGRETFGLHHSRFNPDEAALPVGTAMHVAFALDALDSLRGGRN